MNEKTDTGADLRPANPSTAARNAWLGAGACVVILAAFFAYKRFAPVPTDELVPHRAMYDVTLTRLASGGNLTDISGLMIYEWGRDCGAWNTQSRATLRYVYSDGQATTVNSEQTARESLDGREMAFSVRREEGDGKTTQIKGTARIAPDGSGRVHLENALKADIPLPAGAYFPMAHTKKALSLARAGVTQFWAPLFDGTDADGKASLVNTRAEGVRHLLRPAADAHIDGRLLADTARRFRFAFFDAENAEDSVPEYEMQVDAQDNGVVRAIEIQYDDFAVKQTLKALTPLPVPRCGLARGGAS